MNVDQTQNEYHKQEALRCLKEAVEKFEIIMKVQNPSFKELGLELVREKAREIEELLKKV